MHTLREPFSTLRSLKGNDGLLPVYAGVIAEARKSMDDWVPVQALNAFREFVGRYGLVVEEDCIFEPPPIRRDMDGLDRSPTTHALGVSLKDRARVSPEATVHVFVSRRREWAEEALCSFSYPVTIPQNRLLIRPRVDASRVGAAFGYPRCCVESFLKWNNWRLYSQFSRVYRSERPLDWRANCLPRNTPFMTIFHAPCGPACVESIEMSGRILDAVIGFDPDYGRAIETALKGMFLIVHEAMVFKLHDATAQGNDRASFSRAELITPARPASPARITQVARVMEGAKWIEIAHGMIVTRNGEERFYEVDPGAAWVEDPCLVTFE